MTPRRFILGMLTERSNIIELMLTERSNVIELMLTERSNIIELMLTERSNITELIYIIIITVQPHTLFLFSIPRV